VKVDWIYSQANVQSVSCMEVEPVHQNADSNSEQN